ncbi:hemicentin-1 [Agrilus planipennis]|uniref:Hemicentin-1 n=1 Tax=Agrilus planipennis TaxID=224129 RepID=A0A7F5RAI8_AGRPL|nr:hemicentin-1 [Agrilus planipennis]
MHVVYDIESLFLQDGFHPLTNWYSIEKAKFVEKIHDVEVVEGKSVSLSCNVTPPGHDKVYMVFWFQHGSGIPIYSFDVRGKPLEQARHWSAPEVFGSRAYFRTSSDPAHLVVDDIRRHDEGVYRCRVDFRNAQTRSFLYNLTVVVPPEQTVILDKWGRKLNGTVGPHEEGDDVYLTCRTVGGHPEPVVRWLVNGIIEDEQYEHNAGDVIENRFLWPSVTRKDVDAIFTCQAFNTQLIDPKEAMVTLDLNLKPLTVEIEKKEETFVADRRYEVNCTSAGSRPPAVITWYKGKRQLRRTREETKDNITTSILSFVPTTEDDEKSITCRAENPKVSGLFLETSWKIGVVYPPIVSLRLGSTLNADDIKEGDDVYFECHVKANPLWRRLTWIHDGVILNQNVSARIIRSNQSLVLQKVTRQSAGKYLCSAVNSEGETLSNELDFRVQFSPSCRFNKTILVGASKEESVNITCEVQADPPAKSYRWKFNNSGETMEVASEMFVDTSNGTISMLSYTPISDLDYGTLSCWAINAVGYQNEPCLFQVVSAGKPFSVRNCTLINQTATDAAVSCLAGFDGGLPQHFLLELYSDRRLPTDEPVSTYIAHDEPYFLLTNLEPNVNFKIKIYSVNMKGRSSAVVIEDVTVGETEKRTALGGQLPLSPLLGILIGTAITIVLIAVIVTFRARRYHTKSEQAMFEQKADRVSQNLIPPSSKPLLSRLSSRETSDERDPDIIPVKRDPPDESSSETTVIAQHWYCTLPSSTEEPQHCQYRSSIVGTLPKDARPKDLLINNGHSTTLENGIDPEFNGLAIKERLMDTRLPESCV